MTYADRLYAKMLEGLVLLGANPMACSAVEMIRTATMVLVVAVALRMFYDVAWQVRLMSSVRDWDDRRVLSIWSALGQRRHGPALRIAPPWAPPVFTSGMAVYLREDLAALVSEEELRAILLHERAHIERRDSLIMPWLGPAGFLTIVVCLHAFTLSWFFQPGSMHFGSLPAQMLMAGSAVLLLAIRGLVVPPLRYLREIDCDDRAIGAGADPLMLASAIVKTSRLVRNRYFAPAMPAHHALVPWIFTVERRVSRLVDGSAGRAVVVTRMLRAGMFTLLVAGVMFVASFHARSAVSANPPAGWSQIALP